MKAKDYFLYFIEIVVGYLLLFFLEFTVINYFIKYLTDSESVKLFIYLLFLLAVNPLLTIYLVNTFIDNVDI